MTFLPRYRLGLRARMTLAFGLGALLLSVIFAASTWTFTRQSQLKQRETDELNTAVRNAKVVRSNLTGGSRPEKMRDFLAALPTGATSTIVRESVGASDEAPTTSSNPSVAPFGDLPESLRQTVANGSAARMRFRLNDTPYFAIGIPIAAVDAEYFEIFDLADLERSLERLSIYLASVTILFSVGGATLGWWASRRTLRPLSDVGTAAHAIAQGHLETRLDGRNDPDLEIIISSFNDMAAALQDRIERDARFASDISHELRSPLMTLAASAEVLGTRRHELPERSQAALDLLTEDVNRFSELVADLLEISRFDAGAADLRREPVVLSEFLTQAVHVAGFDGIPVLTDISSTGLVVPIDKRRMAQVVANLLVNAKRYAGGATSIRVERVSDKNIDAVNIVVEDKGPGVPEPDRELIFERFSRGKTAGSRGNDGGSGLGLALVAEHVRLHSGSVRVTDREIGEAGAAFVVTLPINPPGAFDSDDDTLLDDDELDIGDGTP